MSQQSVGSVFACAVRATPAPGLPRGFSFPLHSRGKSLLLDVAASRASNRPSPFDHLALYINLRSARMPRHPPTAANHTPPPVTSAAQSQSLHIGGTPTKTTMASRTPHHRSPGAQAALPAVPTLHRTILALHPPLPLTPAATVPSPGSFTFRWFVLVNVAVEAVDSQSRGDPVALRRSLSFD